MRTIYIPTDETMRSTLSYGTQSFPFAYYLDEIEAYNSRCVEWHWHREFEFSLVVKGTVTCKVGRETICLQTGDGLFINSKIVHRFETADGGTLKNLIFLPEFVASQSSVVFQKYVQPVMLADCGCAVFCRNNDLHGEILRIAEELCTAAESDTSMRELDIQSHTLRLWRELNAQIRDRLGSIRPREDQRTQARLQKMLSYIQTHYRDPVTLGDISAAANISRSEALRCFRTEMQTTPVRYLNDYRLHRAREQLLTTEDTVTAIALASGFESAGYFCRVFREKYRCSPNQLRKMS